VLAGRTIWLGARPVADALGKRAAKARVNALVERDPLAACLNVARRNRLGTVRLSHCFVGLTSAGECETSGTLLARAYWMLCLAAENERDVTHAFDDRPEVTPSCIREPRVGEVMAGGFELKPR
jgi:hypothetical protein